jgi:hypothetical protein
MAKSIMKQRTLKIWIPDLKLTWFFA